MVGTLDGKGVHHGLPRRLLSAYDRMAEHLGSDGEGIELALGFVGLATRFGIPDADFITREELAGMIQAFRVELSKEGHRKAHAVDWRGWGSRGGKATLARYGRRYFGLLSRRRWGRITAAELADARERLRTAREAALAARQLHYHRERLRWMEGRMRDNEALLLSYLTRAGTGAAVLSGGYRVADAGASPDGVVAVERLAPESPYEQLVLRMVERRSA